MNKLTIGWASRDVSSDEPLEIPGQFHMRVSTGVLDPLTVNVLVIDNGDDLVCFLSYDFVSIRPCLVKVVREKVVQLLPEFPADKIVIHATHTHSGAAYHDADQMPHPEVDMASSSDYREFLSDQAADAVREAYESRAPGGIAFGYGYAVTGHSRRTVYLDDLSQRPGAVDQPGETVYGHARMYGPTYDDKFSHYEAGADSFINLLYTFDPDNRLTGAIVNVPCPSQCSQQIRQLSADFWHDVRLAIRREHGDIFLLPQCAASGDLSPMLLHYRKAQRRRFDLKYGPDVVKEMAERKDIAERVACAFDEVLDWAKKDIQTALPITHVAKTVLLEKRLVSDDEVAQEAQHLKGLEESEATQDGSPIERLDHASENAALRTRCKRILLRHESQQSEPRFPMELHVIRIGDVAFATNTFELYMDFMHRIQGRSPFSQTFVVQLAANPTSFNSYLCTERGAQGKGYSATIYCNLVSPQGGQDLVDETVSVLKDIYTACDEPQ